MGVQQERLKELAPEERPLCTVLEVEIGGKCPLTQIDDSVQSINVQQNADTCTAEAVLCEESIQVVHVEKEIDEGCLASVFRGFDCVPHITGVEKNRLTIAIYPPSRTILPDLIEELRSVATNVSVKRLLSVEQEMDERNLVMCDLSILTDKEREALALAVSKGYYGESKDTNLEDISSELDISQSALSHRLRTAEAKLVRDLIEFEEDV